MDASSESPAPSLDAPVDQPNPPPESPVPPVPHAPPRSAAARIVVIAAIIIGLVGIAGMWIKLPYVIFSPGDATPIEDLVKISGTKTYRHDGDVLLLTVRVSNGRPNLWRFLQASWDDNSKVIGEEKYLGNAPRGRVDRASVQMMTESQLAAKEAALARLGYDVTIEGKGARVLQVLADSPADRAGLRTGDVIVAIDGRRISTRDQVGQIVQPERVGTKFSVTVKRDGSERELTVTSEAATSGELTGKPFFGIGAGTEDLKV
ncbi:MAG: PDZ domain-containing protein, partial [Acidimicrobiia bacterium]|nr:PDZ domain-containing protein [Acidimicrobiia bacterium]